MRKRRAGHTRGRLLLHVHAIARWRGLWARRLWRLAGDLARRHAPPPRLLGERFRRGDLEGEFAVLATIVEHSAARRERSERPVPVGKRRAFFYAYRGVLATIAKQGHAQARRHDDARQFEIADVARGIVGVGRRDRV